METLLGKHWHHLPSEEVIDLLATDPSRGLDRFEAARRKSHFGPNMVTGKKGRGPLFQFLQQFCQPLVYILIGAGVITIFLNAPVDATVILGVVLVNAVMGFLQETKAAKAIEALGKKVVTESTVLREGKSARVSSLELVPGDLVLLQSGDRVPADIRLIQARELRTDESALTGESAPVTKSPEVLGHDTVLAERRNMAYASSLVTSGQGLGIVVATGDRTEIGQISELISTAADLETPLTRKIAHFSRILVGVILGLALAMFFAGLWRGQPAVETFLAAVALVVGAIPEGLPAAVTITLAIGVSRMARRHAIIRSMPAVETLGSTTVICSDKTGTLTENQMTVQAIVAAGERFEVSGTGYQPQGVIARAGDPISLPVTGALRECLKAGLLCNDSTLQEANGSWVVHGDPTEGALVAAARKGGLSEVTRHELPRIDAVPFDSEHQYMATLHDAGAGRPRIVYVKGAAERILERCSSALDVSGQIATLDVPRAQEDAEWMASRGLRVLGLARGELPPDASAVTHELVASGLTFLGLQGMIDPPRPEAIAAVKVCHAAGISVKMITGDHAGTAAAIAGQLGLTGGPAPAPAVDGVVTGKAMERLSDEQLIRVAEDTGVFARVTPEQKLRLVAALQSRGHVVAMTGDGVNDAPALRQADIGVAMGRGGTDVAREAADMVLTDDNFASIEAAVEEGRGVFDNLTKFIIWTLPTNLGEGLVILVAVFAGVTLPILPVQILWINMTTSLLLGLMLAFEPKEPGIMSRSPRDPKTPILTRVLVGRIVLVGAMMLAGAFGLFEWELMRGASIAEARTVAVNVFVMVELLYLFNCRSLGQSVFRIGLLSNPWAFAGAAGMLLLQMFFTYSPMMHELFRTAPIDLLSWGWIVIVAVVASLVVGLEKRLRRLVS